MIVKAPRPRIADELDTDELVDRLAGGGLGLTLIITQDSTRYSVRGTCSLRFSGHAHGSGSSLNAAMYDLYRKEKESEAKDA